MTVKIGVAIPCYQGHIERLFDLLKSIQNQTILPNKVVVSTSSTSSFFYTEEYCLYYTLTIDIDILQLELFCLKMKQIFHCY
jgi:hypothetical protein